MTIWLFGLLYVCMIKRIKFHEVKDSNNAKYFTKTIQLIGFIVIIISWPSFNSLMTVNDTSVQNISSNAILSQEAYLQTWLTLFSCIATSLSLRVLG